MASESDMDLKSCRYISIREVIAAKRLIEATTSIIYLCLLVTYAYIIPGIIM